MRFTHKLGLIVSVVLLLALAIPNVSAGGTIFSKSYNFADYTNNKAYEGTSNDTTTEVISPDEYYALNSSNGAYQVYTTVVGDVYAYTRFEFKINESASSINEINITWAGLGKSQASILGEGYILYVWNETGGSWKQERNYYTSAGIQTEYIVYSSGCSDFINSGGYLKVLARSNTTSTGKNQWVDIETDYIDVNVTYFKIWNVTTDKLTYKNGKTILTTWDNEGGFGSGEDYINVEYWDVTNDTQFDLTSHAIAATSSTSEALTSNEVGHTIAVYVYTTSSADGDRLTAITQGDSWPYSIPNAVVTWNSYNDSAHTNQDDTFSGDEHTVYMHGTEFTAIHGYHVGYYDWEGYKVGSETVSSYANGTLHSQYYFPDDTNAAAGTSWHAVAYDDDVVLPPGTYVPNDPNAAADDSFNVEATAIPEFPAVIAAIAVCMLCAVAYMVMRRNKYGQE